MMKKFALICIVAFLFLACGQTPKKQQAKVTEPQKEIVVLTVDDLLKQASDLADKEIVVKGTVMHVCQHGGQRCFLMGSSEDITIRVEAGEKIGTFSQEQMGSDLEITGILKEVKTEDQAHNPGKEHGEGEDHEHDEDSETAHKILARNQDKAEKVFFMEGLSVKEL